MRAFFQCERGIDSGHPWPSGFARAKARLKLLSCNFIEPSLPGSNHFSSDIKKPAMRAFLYLAEREGFEPSVRLTVHTLSRRAHSTALTPLREGMPLYQHSLQETSVS
jgi:hypothetical protein